MSTSVNNQNDDSLYQDFKDWKLRHTNNETTKSKLLQKGSMAEANVYDGYFNQKRQLGQTFDFMEGKDADNDNEYNEQLLKLAKAEIADKDYNGDGVVSYNEYIYEYSLDKLGAGTDKNEAEIYADAEYLAGIIDKKMGNGDGYIQDEELAQFYKNMDGYVGDGTQDFDGKLDIDKSLAYPEFLIGQISSTSRDETIQSIEKIMEKSNVSMLGIVLYDIKHEEKYCPTQETIAAEESGKAKSSIQHEEKDGEVEADLSGTEGAEETPAATHKIAKFSHSAWNGVKKFANKAAEIIEPIVTVVNSIINKII